jgi:predicted metal-binding protein
VTLIKIHAITKDTAYPVKGSLSAEEMKMVTEMAMETGFQEVFPLETAKIVTAHWVGLKCRYGCSNYNTTWCCPPATPSLEETRELLKEYHWALLLVGTKKHEHFYRRNRAKRRNQIREWKLTVALERRLFLSGFYKAFGLPGEACALCERCSFPENCKFPNEKRPSIEACSIDIFKTIELLGSRIHLAKDPNESYHSYSLILLK